MRPSLHNARVAAPLASLLLAALPAGCGSDESDDPEPEQASTPTEASAAGEERSGEQLKLFFTTGEQFRAVERQLTVSENTLETAAEQLVEGPTLEEESAGVEAQTQIPEGTEVEGVTVSGDEAVVKLSDRFLAGVPADPERRSRAQEQELDARLGQITYTLTQFHQVDSARVLAAGKPVAPNLVRTDYAKPSGGAPEIAKPLGAKQPGARALQTRLWELGYLPKAAIDGLDGYRTQQAVMAFQSWQGLERDGVAGPATRAALRSARRPVPRAGGPSKRIEVYRARGVVLLVKGGRTKRAIHASTGGPGNETPAGSFEVFRKELNSWSVPFKTWLPYASYFNQGIAFHGFPEVPPFPASHGCVRLPAPEAPFVYEFAAIGTAVRVF